MASEPAHPPCRAHRSCSITRSRPAHSPAGPRRRAGAPGRRTSKCRRPRIQRTGYRLCPLLASPAAGSLLGVLLQACPGLWPSRGHKIGRPAGRGSAAAGFRHLAHGLVQARHPAPASGAALRPSKATAGSFLPGGPPPRGLAGQRRGDPALSAPGDCEPGRPKVCRPWAGISQARCRPWSLRCAGGPPCTRDRPSTHQAGGRPP